MMRFARTGSWCAALAFSLLTILTACTEEEPTGLGSDLLPGGEIETFEVFLEPDDFLQLDTAFSGYTHPAETLIRVAAREFEGVYNANTIVRFTRPPTSISVRNSQGSVVTDSTPHYFEGDIVIRVDTAGSTDLGAVPLAVYSTAEEWDARSATWTHRVDTAGVQLTWSQPGGTPGERLGGTARTSGDTVFIPIDSATIANWADLDSNVRGAIIRVDPDAANGLGQRVRFAVAGTSLRLRAHSTIDPDTVVTVNANVSSSTFVFDPTPPATAAPIRAGGVPAWRSILVFNENLFDVEVPCPTISSTCRVRLGDADISRAELLFESTQAPDGFVPEDTVRLQARMVLRSDNVPLERSPIVGNIPLGLTVPLKPAAFRSTPDTTRLNMTPYFRALTNTTVEEDDRPSRAVAILTSPESGTVGYATFARRPRLRLILTVDPEVVR